MGLQKGKDVGCSYSQLPCHCKMNTEKSIAQRLKERDQAPVEQPQFLDPTMPEARTTPGLSVKRGKKILPCSLFFLSHFGWIFQYLQQTHLVSYDSLC